MCVYIFRHKFLLLNYRNTDFYNRKLSSCSFKISKCFTKQDILVTHLHILQQSGLFCFPGPLKSLSQQQTVQRNMTSHCLELVIWSTVETISWKLCETELVLYRKPTGISPLRLRTEGNENTKKEKNWNQYILAPEGKRKEIRRNCNKYLTHIKAG